jgi:signal transduction histidine kinase/CheY-like chemotaxis protein
MFDKHRIFAKQVSILYGQAAIVFIGTAVAALATLGAMWSFVPHRVLLAWTGGVLALTAVRAVLARIYHRSEQANTHARAWAYAFASGAFVSGVLWGLLAILLFDPERLIPIVFSVAILAGMTSGSVASLSTYYPAYAAYAIPAILPFTVINFRHGGVVYLAFSGLSLLLLAVNLGYGRLIQRTVVESIRLRFENLDLIDSLTREKEHAEAADRAKSAFLAAASHDLRQPAHALGLFIGTLERITRRDASPALDPVREVVQEMRPTLGALQSLLTGLLDLSRLDAGTVVVHSRAFALQESLEPIAHELAQSAERKGVRLELVRTSAIVESDPVLLRRIVANLVGNAIKFTPRGRVLIGCRRREVEVELQVWDTGIGIPLDAQTRVFDEFVQLDNEERDGEQGLGLGLAIVRRTAALLGHPLRLVSAPGRGSMFAIRLPVVPERRREAAEPAVETTAFRTSAGTVLVIDDEEMVRSALALLLREHGYDVVAKSSADEIIAAHRNGDVTHLIVDYRLAAGATGADAIAQITRALGRSVPTTIITGDTSPDRIREAAAAGHRLLHKPIDPETVLEVVRQGR